MQMSEKEWKGFQKELKKKRLKEDAERLGVPGLADTVISLERKVARLENRLRTAEAQAGKSYAKCLELESVIHNIRGQDHEL